MKKTDEMSDRQLLEELVTKNRRREAFTLAAVVVLFVFLLIVVLKVNRELSKIDAFINACSLLLNEAENANVNINELLSLFDEETLIQLKETIEAFNKLLGGFHIGG